jgi:SAM-dependent methyltransferase
MANPFKDMERKYQESFRIQIDWASLSNERSIEVPWLLNRLKTIKPGTLLDVGFAGSFYQNEILDLGIDYTGLDFDLSRITGQSLYVGADRKSAWKELIKRFKWIQGDIVNLPEELAQQQFDIVMAISTIEHIVPAGYASNYENFQADLKAVANMKTLVKKDGSLLLTFPVGKTAYFFNPDINRNTEILRKTGKFKEGVHDQMFYDSGRIKQIVGDWTIVEKKFYKKDDKQWNECSEEAACSVEHLTSEATTVCLLEIKNETT